jgi:hypothetical protein
MPSSALTYSSTRPPLSTPGTTPVPSHLPTLHRAIRVHHPVAADAEASTRAGNAACARASSRSSTRAFQCSTLSSHLTHPPHTERRVDLIPVPTQLRRASPGGSQDDDIPMVTEIRRKSRPLRLPVDDDEGSDGAQADEEPLAGSRVRTTGLANVDTRRRSAVMSASRRSLIEDDEGRRHSMLV